MRPVARSSTGSRTLRSSSPQRSPLSPYAFTILEAAKSFGHFDVVSDRDGYIRFSPLLVEYEGDYYPSLALEVARWYLNPLLSPVVHAMGQEGGGSVDALELGKKKNKSAV